MPSHGQRLAEVMGRKDWPSIAHSRQVARDDVENPHKSTLAKQALLMVQTMRRCGWVVDLRGGIRMMLVLPLYHSIAQHEHIHLSPQEAVERLSRLADDGLVFIE